ncbi:MAG: 4'-phosphopantetheinyl transferase superfamily protein [Flavobacterium sp.]
MIGNDVIDISQSRIESNWKRKGLIEKIFTSEEQLLIANDADPEMMVWLLWSMKEAAYKVYNRQTKIREYIPGKLVCKILSKKETCILGQVLCMGFVYYTKTIVTKNSIHTVAVSLLNDLDHIVEITNQKIIKDQFGIPHLTNEINQLKEVSVSNHGRFEKIVSIRI